MISNVQLITTEKRNNQSKPPHHRTKAVLMLRKLRDYKFLGVEIPINRNESVDQKQEWEGVS
jgi:hypothetical protein